MKNILITLLIFISSMAFANDTLNVHVISINQTIDNELQENFEKWIRHAVLDSANLIILDMDCYGGEVHATDKLRNIIIKCPVPIWTFVNHNAGSGAALLAVSSEQIFMTSSSVMGAATVVNQNHRVMPEKYQSYVRAKMRASAVVNGRNPRVAEAMVGKKNIRGIYKVLTLSPIEAVKSGYCEGVYENIDRLIRKEVQRPYKIKRVNEKKYMDKKMGIGDTVFNIGSVRDRADTHLSIDWKWVVMIFQLFLIISIVSYRKINC